MAKPLPKAQPPSARNRLRAALPLASLAAQADRTIDNEEARGGCRGGRADFSWDTVKSDKHRNMYLGNSLKANIWRSARPSDWYHEKTLGSSGEDKREELERVKKEEQLVARITAKYGFGALSDLEKYKEMLLKEEDLEKRRSSTKENHNRQEIATRVNKPTALLEELRRERNKMYKN